MVRYESGIGLDKKKPSRISGRIISIGCILIIIAILVGWLYYRHPTNHTVRPTSLSPTETVNKLIEGSASNSQVSNNNPIASPASSTAPEPPNFTVYYPVNPPSSMTTDKSTIAYSKTSFSFSMLQGGQDQFFINEQPAGINFSFQRLKVRLGSPQDITTQLGPGVVGTIGTNLITATRTSKNTLIIVNCTALQCLVPSKNLIGAMQIVSDPTHIK